MKTLTLALMLGLLVLVTACVPTLTLQEADKDAVQGELEDNMTQEFVSDQLDPLEDLDLDDIPIDDTIPQ